MISVCLYGTRNDRVSRYSRIGLVDVELERNNDIGRRVGMVVFLVGERQISREDVILLEL